MKITSGNLGTIQNLQAKSVKGKEDSTSNFKVSNSTSKENAQQVSGLSITSSLFSIQEIHPDKHQRKKQIQKGHKILDELEGLQKELTLGTPNLKTLQSIQTLINHYKDKTNDSKLQGVLDEIELRAAVEIAKHSRSKKR
jgi:hypothetical protein